MATTYPLTPSADERLWLRELAALNRRSEVQSYEVAEQEEMLLRWGLFQTYGADLLERGGEECQRPLMTLPERLAALLITQSSDRNGSISGLRLQTIADYLGTYRETVAAILRAFARQDFVALGRGRIDILDDPAMRELAGM